MMLDPITRGGPHRGGSPEPVPGNPSKPDAIGAKPSASDLPGLFGGLLGIPGSGAAAGGAAPAGLPALTGGTLTPGGNTAPPATAQGPGTPGAPNGTPSKPSADDKRPAGDNRGAQDIIGANPTLKGLGNQSGVKDNLKKQVGDYEHDPDAAYRASKVIDYVKSSKTSDGQDRSGNVTADGKIDGFTKDGDARHGTEAGMLQDFGKGGYSALPDGHSLDKTRDQHVKQDGTNMDNTTFAGHEIAHGIASVAGKFSQALDNLPGPLKSFLGPLHMVASGVSGAMNVADTAARGGDVKQAGKDMASGMMKTGSNIASGIGELAADTAGKVPGVGKLVSAGVEIGASNISGGLNTASTAVEGGDVKQAAKDWGANVAGTAAGATVGLADPTGMASGAARNAVTAAINPSVQ